MKHSPLRSLQFLPAALGLALGLLANNAKAANAYFDVNGTSSGYGIVNGGTYSWDDSIWATGSGGTSATGYWVPGSFARFSGGSSGFSYTVVANNLESMAGLYETVSGVSLTINAAGSGGLDIVAAPDGSTPPVVQGFLVSGAASSVTINAPISGAGGIYPQLSGKLNLFGNNTYSGGTYLGNSSTLTYFNNANSFGSGTITVAVPTATVAALLATAPVTLPNKFVNTVSGAGVNFAASANCPVVSSGNWELGANNLILKNNGNSTAPLTVAGVISGSAGLTLSANNSGKIILSGANTYTGPTVVTGPGGPTGAGSSAVTLRLGAANTIATSSSLVLAGGILDPGGFNHALSATTLSVTLDSSIDFISGASELNFANSSEQTWTGNLNLANWDPSVDKLRFGTDETGLTAAQLAAIQFNGGAFGTAQLDPLGYLVVPEPSIAMFGLLGLGLAAIARCRKV